MANGVYNRGKYLFASGGITTSTDLRTLLVTSSYTFADTHNFVSDVAASEVSVSGYGRYDHASVTVTEDDTNDFAYLDLDDATFTALVAGQTIGGAIVYKYNAADAAAEVIAFYDVTDTPTNGGDVTIQWAGAASGAVLKLA
jgi:hypothetical protein